MRRTDINRIEYTSGIEFANASSKYGVPIKRKSDSGRLFFEYRNDTHILIREYDYDWRDDGTNGTRIHGVR